MELQYLARQAHLHGAHLLVTTEKDRMNFPRRSSAAIAPLKLAWLEIELELESSGAFFAYLESTLRPLVPFGPSG